jgi:cytoskeleton protein RodZ
MAEIGEMLREARIRARIDITEVEARTKIRAKYLRAIENGEFDLLPGPIYVKSFLKTYGDYLGLDSRMLLDEYRRSHEHPSEHELRAITPLGRERGGARSARRGRGAPPSRSALPSRGAPQSRGATPPRRPLLPPWAIIAAVLVALVVVLGVIGANSGGGSSPPPTGLRGGKHRRRRTVTRHQATVKPVVRRPRAVTLTLTPTGPVYVCLVNGRGRQLIPGQTFAPGQAIPTARAGRLLLTLGNANVRMTVDGKPVTVNPSPTAIGLELTPGHVSPLPPSAQPTCT